MNPYDSKSTNELEDYLKCIRSLKVGDQVILNNLQTGTSDILAEVVAKYSDIPWGGYIELGDHFPLIVVGSQSVSFYRYSQWMEPLRGRLGGLQTTYPRFDMVGRRRIFITKIIRKQ